MDQQLPLNRARELILSMTSEADAHGEIAKIEALKGEEKKRELTNFYNSAEAKASAGDTVGISIILRVCEYFGDQSHDRMLLHYIAQAEANKALSVSTGEKPGEFHHKELQEALKLISDAFADADLINKQVGVS